MTSDELRRPGQAMVLASRLANIHPGIAPAGAAGSNSNHPTGAPPMIRLMPTPSIIPPTSDPITPDARPRYSMSLRLIMLGSETRAAGIGNSRRPLSQVTRGEFDNPPLARL
jgi:hypothetical protein